MIPTAVSSFRTYPTPTVPRKMESPSKLMVAVRRFIVNSLPAFFKFWESVTKMELRVVEYPHRGAEL